MSLPQRLNGYMASADPHVAAANKIALLVAGNQPFYPLYLFALVGHDAWPALLTFVSTPFFIAVPALARCSSLGGRVMLLLAGLGNTVLCARIFGTASGVEWFYVPCAIIALMIFRRTEAWARLSLTILPALLFVGLSGRYGAPLQEFTGEQYGAIARINLFSALGLTAFLLLLIIRKSLTRVSRS